MTNYIFFSNLFMLLQKNLVLFRLILLNEQDILGDSSQKYQRLCYVTLLNRTDFISSDDISKLRQVSKKL